MNPLLYLKSRKPSIVAGMVIDKLFHSKLNGFDKLTHLFKDKYGIEIGGPSRFFTSGGFMPVYELSKKVDGCNFSSQTTWEGHINEGETYQYTPGKYGHQYICEGADVALIPKNNYDFVLSCNNLEHIANPLKAVSNWLGLLKSQGTIVLVLPRKQSNFDHNRPVTKFEHLLTDYNNNIGEDDLTHVEEILQQHDLKLDPLAGDFENFKKRSYDNYQNRCLHHHVYDLQLLEQICAFFKLTVVAKTSLTADHVIVATKG